LIDGGAAIGPTAVSDETSDGLLHIVPDNSGRDENMRNRTKSPAYIDDLLVRRLARMRGDVSACGYRKSACFRRG
jgi:hypothetical protein